MNRRITPLIIAPLAVAVILPRAGPREYAPVPQVGSQRLSVIAGSTLRTVVAPSSRVAVPIIVDASALSGSDVGAIATNVTWAPTRLWFDSVRAGTFGTFSASSAASASGSVTVSATNSAGVTGTVTVGTVYFTAAAVPGSTTVSVSWPQVATSRSGNDLSAGIDGRPIDVCVRAPAGRYGDTNGDVSVDIIDAQQIARYSVGLPVANPAVLIVAGDVTGEGLTNVIDAQQVARYSVGLTSTPRMNTTYFTVPAVASMTIPAPTGTLGVNHPLRLSATPRDGAGSSIAGCVPVIWTSLTPAVASVDSSGFVTGFASGTATIRAASGGQVADITLPVAQNVAPPDPVVVAVGDIACGAQTPAWALCQHAAVASVVTSIAPAAVLLLGDTQYEVASLADYNANFNVSWGAFKHVMRPAPGNHEYDYTPGASGYYDYFNGVGAQTGRAGDRSKGYYSYNVGAWHLIALNSNCDWVACSAGSVQEQWLRADLALNTSACTLAYWHHPLFSSGPHGDSPATRALWTALQDFGAELVLTGHDHDYERFVPQNALGAADNARGIRGFVVGTGGVYLASVFPTPGANSAFRGNTSFGVLKLTLRASSYDWAFVPTGGGAVFETGSATCSPRVTSP